jgi:hypothetical protein
MADKRRFELFAALLAARFPQARRVFDVAGGMGRLNEALPVRFCEREFTLDEPPDCELVVGLHCDGATRVIIEYAAKHRLPFAVVPCCSDNSMPYNPWMRHLHELAHALGLATDEVTLDMAGRARVILWRGAQA